VRYIFTPIVILLLTSCFERNVRSEVKLHSPYIDTLIDKQLGLTFYLETAMINVYAYDKNGTLIWKTDPLKDNNLEDYLIKRPKIVYFNFHNDRFTDFIEVIGIRYNSTQFGYLDKVTGKFDFKGRD
jgi:hypothetical protein